MTHHYIFFTSEGETFTPFFDETKEGGNDSNNCQMLGYGKGNTSKEAFEDFMKNCYYLLETTFNDIVAIELKDLECERFYFMINTLRPIDEKIG
ncbi:MAG: hypothetical protein ACTSXA_06440 [Candidatus Heimdallarchaeota archaeon]